jgi:beta-phosphoglucomutase
MPGVYSSKRNLLFDLDGTLIDSVPLHARAYTETLREKYPDVAQAFDYAAFGGRNTPDVFRALGIADEVEVARLVAEKQRRYREAVARGELQVFPGAAALLKTLRGRDCTLVLVTGGSRTSVEQVLERTALRDFFAGIITADDTPRGKPAPDPFLQALARFQLDSRASLVIEDAESGIVAAQAAGLDAVVIHSPLSIPGVRRARDMEELAGMLAP